MNRKKSLPCLIYIIHLSLHIHILDADDLDAKLALIEEKIQQTNSTGIFIQPCI